MSEPKVKERVEENTGDVEDLPNSSTLMENPNGSSIDRNDPALTSYAKTHIGPLPTPEDFAKYNLVLPNAADRILKMAENEQTNRHEISEKILKNDRWRICGSIGLGLALLPVAGIAAYQGNALIALPIALSGLLSIVVQIVDRHLSK